MYQDFSYGNPVPMYRQRITMQQAQEIALQRVPGKVMHVDMDLENGVLVYEVFIMTPQGMIFEVEILAKNGKILKIEQENDNDND
ncbi:PepSY domain-containing protein [Bacillus cereus]|uniref:PepSY domain-containing protein n=1 Tax=Bacillus cereus TaxID=1396 RepID=UPI0010BDF2EB|nr:PepSY domain-containing protein [Bacillus cereus]MED3581292.1 PepSY domain-containing protein [Bacillus thuringiensis]MCU4937523.1 PepSY domain-containing protein [Bacillus cereus]MCU5457854.1 PepSY domain-containing protein [Bacillus cereus]MCU5507107.1 PepSY domain-containing protein [Bacillus cereus]MCU5512921.1 PepSY domain-containing protein [Bacillus cereus]